MTQSREDSQQGPDQRVELKYCEGCGGLQVRPVGSCRAYCLRCEAKQADERIPVAQTPRRTRRRARLPRGLDVELQGCAAPRMYLSVVEVRA
jgi:hypothetical protein